MEKWKFVKSDEPAEEKKKLTEKESYLMKNQLITTLGGKFLGWNFEVEFWSKYWHTSMYPLCNQSCLYSLVLSSTHRQTIGIYRVGHKGPKFLNPLSLILNLNIHKKIAQNCQNCQKYQEIVLKQMFSKKSQWSIKK